MKTKDKKSLSSQTKEELVKEVTDLKSKLVTMKLERFTKQMKNTREAREMRKKIAVIKTYITAKGATI